MKVSLIILSSIIIFSPLGHAQTSCASLFGHLPSWEKLEKRKARPEIVKEIYKTPGDFQYHIEFLARLSDAEIQILAENPHAAAALKQSRSEYERETNYAAPFTPSVAQVGARTLFLRHHFLLKPAGKHFSWKQFSAHAIAGGFKIENLPVGFRIDQRSPELITQAAGFYPSSQKSELTLIEHSMKGTSGGYFVSLTTQEGNPHILPQVMFTNFIKDNNSEQEWPGALIGFKVAYEYRLENIRGVRSGELSLDLENEFITNGISLQHITHYRKVTMESIRSHGFHSPEHLHTFGPWLSFQSTP